jgi:hypothetical protein
VLPARWNTPGFTLPLLESQAPAHFDGLYGQNIRPGQHNCGVDYTLGILLNIDRDQHHLSHYKSISKARYIISDYGINIAIMSTNLSKLQMDFW